VLYFYAVPIVHLHGGNFRLTWIEYHNRWLRVSYFKFFYFFVCPKSSNSHQPVITVKKWCDSGTLVGAKEKASQKGNQNIYGHEVEIPGGCRVVYRPDSPRCGAKVWIETLYDVRVISWREDGSG
ncbi:MAG: hypothetical protein RLO37_02155, partial [Coleofasciculus chthonoplastes F1-TOW-03]